ncbi:MAG: FAD-dependent oxidoreductase [Candidatus Omnitrophica bacterium]|nr:FAD-dependent oxidoreductase [Candidatus Omnitrophota bacterium]
MHELIIIGAGPAGITASVYAARKNMDFILISKDIGGQAAWSGDVENYTGYQFITGPELAKKFEEHMRKYEINLKENEAVLELNKENDKFIVKTNKAVYESRTVIIAAGKRSRELNALGENEFKNKGLTYCATCDAPLFKGKTVAVIGGGNSALDAALQLTKIAKHVFVINISSGLGGDAIMRSKLEEASNVSILNNSKVTEILGGNFVSGIKVGNESGEKILDVEGVFVEIGLLPNSEFTKDIEKNSLGEIKVNYHNETNIPGIFAAGDVTDVPEKQIIIAAGEGSKATLSAFRYLAQNRFKT